MKPNFNKVDGLLPVIIQDAINLKVLMLGYMNEEAYKKTLSENKVTFFSRSRNTLWTKGDTSGNFLNVVSMHLDCDNDSILIVSKPEGPTCHTGTNSCFNHSQEKGFLYELEETIRKRFSTGSDSSYVKSLHKKGINKIAQKVGEEAVELIIEAKDNSIDLFKNEAADLLFHYLILLQAKGITLSNIEDVLLGRSNKV